MLSEKLLNKLSKKLLEIKSCQKCCRNMLLEMQKLLRSHVVEIDISAKVYKLVNYVKVIFFSEVTCSNIY